MTKQEFVDAVAGKTGLSKRDAGAAVDAFLDTVEETLKAGDTVTFTGFGKFHTTHPGGPHGRQPAQPEREGPDQGGDRAEVLGRLGAQEGRQLAARPPPRNAERAPPGPSLCALLTRTYVRLAIERMQLSFDAADRLVELVEARRGPVPADEAARSLFALASAPTAIARVAARRRRLGRRAARLARRGGRARRPARGARRCSRHASFVVFDLETTGLSPARSRIVEIGAQRVDALELGATFETLVNPGVPLPAAITRADRDRRRATCAAHRAADLAVRRFLSFAGDAVLVAHNARFDMGVPRPRRRAAHRPAGGGAGRRHGLARPAPARAGGRRASASRTLAHFFGTSRRAVSSRARRRRRRRPRS